MIRVSVGNNEWNEYVFPDLVPDQRRDHPMDDNGQCGEVQASLHGSDRSDV